MNVMGKVIDDIANVFQAMDMSTRGQLLARLAVIGKFGVIANDDEMSKALAGSDGMTQFNGGELVVENKLEPVAYEARPNQKTGVVKRKRGGGRPVWAMHVENPDEEAYGTGLAKWEPKWKGEKKLHELPDKSIVVVGCKRYESSGDVKKRFWVALTKYGDPSLNKFSGPGGVPGFEANMGLRLMTTGETDLWAFDSWTDVQRKVWELWLEQRKALAY